jgi:hypothetical protein
MSWIKERYKEFLWFIGFPEGLTISACLVAQKQRLGGGWWAMVTLTIILVAATLAFVLWLVYHIVVEMKPKG